MNTIARSMVESAWECVPACPAMDMRDDGTRFEILFALPEGTGAEQVQVSAKGGILTLALTSPGGAARSCSSAFAFPAARNGREDRDGDLQRCDPRADSSLADAPSRAALGSLASSRARRVQEPRA